MGKHKKGPSIELEAPTPEQLARGNFVRRPRLKDGGNPDRASDYFPGYVNKAECELDRMLAKGRLGARDDAERRHKAGMWLRTLYLKTHATEGVMSYHDAGRDQSEMSDEMDWNTRCYRDTWRELDGYWRLLYPVCCLDHRSQEPLALVDALDALADHRGM